MDVEHVVLARHRLAEICRLTVTGRLEAGPRALASRRCQHRHVARDALDVGIAVDLARTRLLPLHDQDVVLRRLGDDVDDAC